MPTRKTIRCLFFAILVIASASIACNRSPQAKEAKYLANGKLLLAKKDYARALLEFKNAANVMPKDAEPYYQLGLCFLATGDIGAAAGAFSNATLLNPKHAAAELKLAELLASTGDKGLLRQAATRLERIMAISPDNAEASDTLALADWKLGRTDDAMKLLEDTLKRFPSHLNTSAGVARLKLAGNDTKGAEEVLKKAVALAPRSIDAALAIGQFYLALKEPDKAEPEFQRALRLDPKSAPALAALGLIQTNGKRVNEADQTYRRLAALPDKQYRAFHAMFLYMSGKREPALAEFKQLLKEDPDDRTTRTRLLAAYVDMGKTAEAQTLLASALKRNPKDTDALMQRSALNLKSGKTAEAETDLHEVLHFQPDSAETHFALANVYKARGMRRNERQEMNEALRLKPGMLAARVALAKDFIGANEGKAALDLLNKAPKEQQHILAVAIQRNWALLATGDTKTLEAELNAELKSTRYPELLLQNAILKMTQHDYPGARADAEEVLKSRPDEVRAAQLVTESYLAQKEPAKAMESLQQMAESQPKSAPLHLLLGQLYAAAADLPDARKAYEAAKSANPKSDADIALAQLDLRENRVDSARQRLTAVIRANPGNVPALLQLAALDDGHGSRAEAIQRYRSVLDLDSSNALALNNLAYDLAIDKPDEALKFAQQAAEIVPDNPTVQDTLGWVYFQKGLYGPALNYLKTAFARQPTPKRQFHLAMCYLKSGDQDQGLKNMQAALQKDPDLAKEERVR